MANENQYKTTTKYIATRGVKEYRKAALEWIKPSDKVLEIGCEWGTSSALLFGHCHTYIATDISSECIERAKQKYPKINFAVLDVFNINAALDFKIPFNKILIDVSGFSGYRSLLDVLALLNTYASVFEPEAIIIKSGALKQLARNCVAWRK